MEDNGNTALRGVANATWAWQPADELIKIIRGKLRAAYHSKIIALASEHPNLATIPHPSYGWFAQQFQRIALELLKNVKSR